MTLTQRDVRIDDADHRLRQTRQLRRQTVLTADRLNLYPTRDEGASDGTSRQSNTHSIESREVRYPWHPWYGRTVWVYQSLKKHGRGILRCRIEQDVRVGLLELPEWMLEASAGCIQLAKTPAVACEALCDLKALLQGYQTRSNREGVVEVQHQLLQPSGGADAEPTGPSRVYSTETVPAIEIQTSSMAEPARGDSTKDGENVGTVIPPTLGKSKRLQRRKGGAR
jgi:hypothetical protein